MTHLVRRKTDAEWALASVVTGADMIAIDEGTTKPPNGHEGSTHAPAALLAIGGAGVSIMGPWQVTTGAVVSTQGTSVSRILFAKKTPDDAFQLYNAHDGTSRLLLRYTGEAYAPTLSDFGMDPAILIVFAKKNGFRFLTPLQVHDGATISNVRFTIRVGSSHANVPEYLPRFRVVRIAKDGVVEQLRAEDSVTDFDGFRAFSPTPASGAAWFNGGAAQTFDYVTNQNNVVDLAKYNYFAEIIEEAGVGAWSAASGGNRFCSTIVTNSAISLLANRH